MKAWNKGKAVGQKAPLTPRHIHAIKTVLANEGKFRDLALFSTAIDTMLGVPRTPYLIPLMAEFRGHHT